MKDKEFEDKIKHVRFIVDKAKTSDHSYRLFLEEAKIEAILLLCEIIQERNKK
jgi:hypothetical protein